MTEETKTQTLEKTHTLDVDGLAKETGYCTQYIRRMAQRSLIPAIKKGRRWYFNAEDVRKQIFSHNDFAKRAADNL